MIEVDMTTLSLLSGAILPLLVNLATKADVDRSVKVYMNLALSLVTGAVSYLVTNDGAASWQELTTAVIQTYLASSVSYMAAYKPSGVSAKIETKTASVGVGTPRPLTPRTTNTATSDPDPGNPLPGDH